MSQNTLIEKIKKDGATTVAEIKASEKTQVEAIQRGIEAEVAELIRVKTEALEKTKAQLELVAISKAKQAGNIAVQSAKRAQIDEVFASVAEELEKQSSEEYVTFFKKYVSDIIPKETEIEYVQAPASRESETSEILKQAGLSGAVKGDSSIKAGLIVRAKDGVYDITLARLMGEKRAELEMVIVNKVMA